MENAAREKLLLIGYGNTLRGDDAVGPFVVSEVAARHGDWVTACVVQQLTPELCAIVAEHGAVVFVDASAVGAGAGCRLVPVESIMARPWGAHLSSPASLLALAEELYGARPHAWCVAVPGEDFRVGDRLSALAWVNAKEAARIIGEFLFTTPMPPARPGCPPPGSP